MRSTRCGQPAALRGLMLDARARRADDGELGGDEQPVGEDEQQDDRDRDQDLDHCVVLRRRGHDASGEHRLERAIGDPLDLELVVADRRPSRPAAGRWPSASVTRPPTVVASVSHVVSSSVAASSTAMSPGRRMRPSGSVSAAGCAGLELVADVAEQLGQHVLQRQQPRGAAELVDDQRLMRAPLAKVAQHPVGGHALVHASESAGSGRRASRPACRSTNQRTRSLVCRMPTMLSMRVAIDGQPRVRALRDDARRPR